VQDAPFTSGPNGTHRLLARREHDGLMKHLGGAEIDRKLGRMRPRGEVANHDASLGGTGNPESSDTIARFASPGATR